MVFTNILGLPEPIVSAIQNDPYSKDGVDFSATELIAPPYQRKLMRELGDKVEVDVSDRVWSLFGQSVHSILERAKMSEEWVMERRYVSQFYPGGPRSVSVGAKIDVFNRKTGVLSDYKVTSIYKFKTGFDGFQTIPPEYEQQLNIQAELMYRETGEEPEKLQIIGLLRDWRPSELKSVDGYPKHKMSVMDIPLWPSDKRVDFILDRIRKHQNANPEPCSATERWERPAKYALMKKGQKRAVKLYDEYAYAATAAMGQPDWYVEDRPGERVRCNGYCDVASVCPAYQEFLRARQGEKKPEDESVPKKKPFKKQTFDMVFLDELAREYPARPQDSASAPIEELPF